MVEESERKIVRDVDIGGRVEGGVCLILGYGRRWEEKKRGSEVIDSELEFCTPFSTALGGRESG